jgi:hypothetical protein
MSDQSLLLNIDRILVVALERQLYKCKQDRTLDS